MISFFDGLFGKPSPGKFARIMTRALREAGSDESVRFDSRAFSLHVGQGQVMNLRNAYQEYCAVPRSKRRGYLARFVGTARAPGLPDDFSEVREALVPRVRERAYYELLPMQLEDGIGTPDPKKLPTFRPLGETLALGVAADFPDRISEISADLLEKWGLGFEEALETGRENLWKRSVAKWHRLAEGVWMSPWKDNLDVCRLALPTLFHQLSVDGDVIAFAPNRDNLIVTGARDFAGQGVAAACAEGLLDEPRPMNASPIILDGLEWKPYAFGSDHPVAPLFRRLRIRALADDYAAQKSLLGARFEREGRDVFIASFLAFEKKETGHVRSVASWSETVDTLLPKVDSVVFNVPVGEERCRTLGEAPWDRVVEVVGHKMTREEGLYPERYRVQEFPTDREIAALELR